MNSNYSPESRQRPRTASRPAGFPYERMPVGQWSSTEQLPIRLFSLPPRKVPGGLFGELHIRREYAEYEALSYSWDAIEGSIPLTIPFNMDWPVVLITKNLHDALQSLRLEDAPRILWIDALCVNQNDKEEKSAQIAFMDQIFREATRVCVWLGAGSNTSHTAWHMIRSMLNFHLFEQLLRPENVNIEGWKALTEIMRLSWFNRRWIIQEIAFAKSAVIRCGNDEMPWNDFADAVTLFGVRIKDIDELFRRDQDTRFLLEYLDSHEALSARQLVKLITSLQRGRVVQDSLTLEALVCGYTTFQTSNPHDNIYAVLSLASDATGFYRKAVHQTSTVETPTEVQMGTVRSGPSSPAVQSPERTPYEVPDIKLRNSKRFFDALRLRTLERRFVVDYQKSFFEVCQDFIRFIIVRTGKIDILLRPWAPVFERIPEENRQGIADGLPSWICPVSKAPFQERPNGAYSRVNGDLFIGGLGAAGASYRASSARNAYYPLGGSSFAFGETPLDQRSLYVPGFILGRIAKIKFPAIEGTIPHDWIRFGGWKDRQDPPSDEFWRTLVADRDINNQNAPHYYRRACQHIFGQLPEGGGLNVLRHSEDSQAKHLTEYLNRLKAVVWSRRLFRLAHNSTMGPEEGEYAEPLGLAPYEAQTGDLVCILQGCSVPVILRPAEENNSHSRKLPKVAENREVTLGCRIIGECYVHTMMYGAAYRIRTLRESERVDTGDRFFEMI